MIEMVVQNFLLGINCFFLSCFSLTVWIIINSLKGDQIYNNFYPDLEEKQPGGCFESSNKES